MIKMHSTQKQAVLARLDRAVAMTERLRGGLDTAQTKALELILVDLQTVDELIRYPNIEHGHLIKSQYLDASKICETCGQTFIHYNGENCPHCGSTDYLMLYAAGIPERPDKRLNPEVEEKLEVAFEQEVQKATDQERPIHLTPMLELYIKKSVRFINEGGLEKAYGIHISFEQSFDPSYRMTFEKFTEEVRKGYGDGDELQLRRLIDVEGTIYYDNEYVE